MAIKVLPCSCKHEYQDEKYGQGKRVHNNTMKENQYRCTVCSTNHDGK